MDNTRSLVCVAMPVYNGAKTIELALKSLLCQTYSNWICIIVNDGSTDNTKEILDSITDNRIKVIHLTENRGRGNARQLCLNYASGDYLTFLDADDFYHPEKIEQQVNILNSNEEICLVSCGQGSFDDKYNLRLIRGIKYSGFQYFCINDEFKFVPVTSMIRLYAAKDFKYNIHLNASEDIDFFSVFLLNKMYYVHNQILYFYGEFNSINYSKIIAYNLNSIKRIIYNYNSYNLLRFFTQFSYKILRLCFYVAAYPFLGKDFFINKRGVAPDLSHNANFNYIYTKLIAIEL